MSFIRKTTLIDKVKCRKLFTAAGKQLAAVFNGGNGGLKIDALAHFDKFSCPKRNQKITRINIGIGTGIYLVEIRKAKNVKVLKVGKQ